MQTNHRTFRNTYAVTTPAIYVNIKGSRDAFHHLALNFLSTRTRLAAEHIHLSNESPGTFIYSSSNSRSIILANVKQLWPVGLLLDVAELAANALLPNILYLGGSSLRFSIFLMRIWAVSLGMGYVEYSKLSPFWTSISCLRQLNNNLLDKPGSDSTDSNLSILTLPSLSPERTESNVFFATKSANHIIDLLPDFPSRTRKACWSWLESGSLTKETAQYSSVIILVGSSSLRFCLDPDALIAHWKDFLSWNYRDSLSEAHLFWPQRVNKISMKTKDDFKMTGINRADNLLRCLCFHNLVDRARDPLWEESWGSRKKLKRIHRIPAPLQSDPATLGKRARLRFVNDGGLARSRKCNVRKKYVPSSFKNSCPRIKTLNSNPVKVFHEMNYRLRVLGNVLKEEQYEEVNSGCTCIKKIVWLCCQ